MFAKSVFSFGQVLLLAMLMSFATTAVANGIATVTVTCFSTVFTVPGFCSACVPVATSAVDFQTAGTTAVAVPVLVSVGGTTTTSEDSVTVFPGTPINTPGILSGTPNLLSIPVSTSGLSEFTGAASNGTSTPATSSEVLNLNNDTPSTGTAPALAITSVAKSQGCQSSSALSPEFYLVLYYIMWTLCLASFFMVIFSALMFIEAVRAEQELLIAQELQ